MPGTVLYEADEGVATLTLNRPDRLNTIVPELIEDLNSALARAWDDRDIRAIRLRGAGRVFCAGYDISWGAEAMEGQEAQEVWDPIADYQTMSRFVDAYMELWRSPKPVIAQVHGWCVGGGSDMALCADLIVASDDARIGTPYARMWGAYLTGMWIYRLGLTKVKWHALTGHPLSGAEAAEEGLVNVSVPFERLEDEVAELAGRLAGVPLSQLAAMKLVVNQAYENMGLASTQVLGPILDGLMRNTPDAKEWIELAQREGVGAAIAQRDGPFGDYSQAPPDGRPDPSNRIEP